MQLLHIINLQDLEYVDFSFNKKAEYTGGFFIKYKRPEKAHDYFIVCLMTKNNFHIKLSQSVFSDETSKNYYFTTLYIGENKKKQTYLIDTSSGIMSSTCSHETGLNPQKLHYIYQNKSIPKLKCDSKVCDILPANVCHDKNNKDEKAKKLCSYDSSNNSTEGVKGYYVKDIAYLEEEAEYISPIQRRKYHSYAMPIGCSTGEFGKFKDVLSISCK